MNNGCQDLGRSPAVELVTQGRDSECREASLPGVRQSCERLLPHPAALGSESRKPGLGSHPNRSPAGAGMYQHPGSCPTVPRNDRAVNEGAIPSGRSLQLPQEAHHEQR